MDDVKHKIVNCNVINSAFENGTVILEFGQTINDEPYTKSIARLSLSPRLSIELMTRVLVLALDNRDEDEEFKKLYETVQAGNQKKGNKDNAKSKG